jgi:hypothetical protein
MNPPNTQLAEPVVFADDIIYPDSDGKPMADNTQQFRWITTIKTNSNDDVRLTVESGDEYRSAGKK